MRLGAGRKGMAVDGGSESWSARRRWRGLVIDQTRLEAVVKIVGDKVLIK